MHRTGRDPRAAVGARERPWYAGLKRLGHLVGLALCLSLAACDDPAEAERPFRVAIDGPETVRGEVFGTPPYEVLECWFFLTARVTGGTPEHRAYLHSPAVQLRFANGETEQYGMLVAWYETELGTGGETEGEFYLSADEPFEATLVSAWIASEGDQWVDDGQMQYGNSITLSCE